MADSKISLLIAGNHSATGSEDALAGHSPGRNLCSSSLWQVPPSSRRQQTLTVEQLFQTFDFRSHDPHYSLKIKQTLTVKPDNFYMHVTPRKVRNVRTILGSGADKVDAQAVKAGSDLVGSEEGRGARRAKLGLSVYYGMSPSDSGIEVCSPDAQAVIRGRVKPWQ